MPPTRPPYPPEFRAEAVRLVRESGNSIQQIAADLGVSEASLRKCVRQAPIDAGERMQRIRAIHAASRYTCAAPRVLAELRLAHGVRCSGKRVARRMRVLGLVWAHRRSRRGTTRRDTRRPVHPDLVQRRPSPALPTGSGRPT